MNTSGNVEHCWRAGATQLGICPRCSGCITCRQAHSFPFVKQDRCTCRRYMRIVHWQNGEQVSRTVLTLRFQLVSRGQLACSSIMCTSNPSVFARCSLEPWRWEEVQPRSVTEGCSTCRRMEESSLAGKIDWRVWKCVKIWNSFG